MDKILIGALTFIFTFLLVASLSDEADNRAVKRGWMKVGDQVYLITPAKPVAVQP